LGLTKALDRIRPASALIADPSCPLPEIAVPAKKMRRRAARMGRNPATGEAVKIKASKKVAKELKGAV
jgi:hypothetical protein